MSGTFTFLSQTFRDTDACREMVLDYTCLWWGSANEMYDNRCGVEAQVGAYNLEQPNLRSEDETRALLGKFRPTGP